MEGDAELQDLYREVLLDYFRSGSHKGRLDPADFRSHGINPVCGDEIELTMTEKDGRIQSIRYDGHGCVISQASAAMMAEALEGKPRAKAAELAAAFKDMMLSKEKTALPEELSAADALEGVRKFPLRVKCATLSWNTFLQGLAGRKP
jgi:nitrogen fixation protein NifU and related proteins